MKPSFLLACIAPVALFIAGCTMTKDAIEAKAKPAIPNDEPLYKVLHIHPNTAVSVYLTHYKPSASAGMVSVVTIDHQVFYLTGDITISEIKQ